DQPPRYLADEAVPKLSNAALSDLRVRMARLARVTGRTDEAEDLADAEQWWAAADFARARWDLLAARQRQATAGVSADGPTVKRAEERLLAAAREPRMAPYFGERRWYQGDNTPAGREAFARDRVERIAAGTEGEAIDRQLQADPN